MWQGYITAIDEFLAEHQTVKAVPVVDRFHVAQQYRAHFETLRKKELKRLKKELPKAVYDRDCKGMLWILRHNHCALTPDQRQRLRALFIQAPKLHQAYTLREELTAIFNLHLTVDQAQQRLLAWVNKVERTDLDTFDPFIKTLRNHWQAIVNYFEKRITSGFVEGFNNKSRTIIRRCYGLRNTSSLFQRIWLDINGGQRFFDSTT